MHIYIQRRRRQQRHKRKSNGPCVCVCAALLVAILCERWAAHHQRVDGVVLILLMFMFAYSGRLYMLCWCAHRPRAICHFAFYALRFVSARMSFFLSLPFCLNEWMKLICLILPIQFFFVPSSIIRLTVIFYLYLWICYGVRSLF